MRFTALQQFRLVFKKILLQRLRAPVVLCLEIFIPLVVLLLLTFLRVHLWTWSEPQCVYEERPLPNDGFIGFVKSFICNFGNTCVNKEFELRKPTEIQEDVSSHFNEIFNRLVSLGQPVSVVEKTPFGDRKKERIPVFGLLDAAQHALNMTVSILKSPFLQKFLNNQLTTKDLLRNPDAVVRYLSQDRKLMSPDVARTLIDSGLNFYEIFKRYQGGFVDYRHILCDEYKLGKFLILSKRTKGVTIGDICNELCTIPDNKTGHFVKAFESQVDLGKLIGEIGDAVSVFTDDIIAQGFYDLAGLVDTIVRFKTLTPLLKNYNQLSRIPYDIAMFGETFQKLVDDDKLNVTYIGEIMDALQPLLRDILEPFGLWAPFSANIGYLNIILKWLSPIIEKFDVDRLSLANVLLFPSGVNDFLFSIGGITEADWHFIKSAKFDKDQAGFLLYSLEAAGNDSKKVLCQEPGLSNLLHASGSSQQESIRNFQRQICKNDLHAQFSLDINRLSTSLSEYKQSSRKVNFTEIFKNGQNAVNGIMNLLHRSSKFMTTLKHVSFEKVVDTFFLMFDSSIGTNMEDIIGSTLTGVQRILMESDRWSSIQPVLHFVGYVVHIGDRFADRFRQTAEELMAFFEGSGAVARSSFQKLGKKLIQNVLQRFLNLDVLMKSSQHDSFLSSTICDLDELSTLLRMDEENTLLVLNELCVGDYVTLIRKLESIWAMNETDRKILRRFTEFVQEDGLSQPSFANLSTIYSSSKSAYRQLITNDSRGVLSRWAVGLTPRNSTGSSTGDIESAIIEVIIENFGLAVEKSSFWKMHSNKIGVLAKVIQQFAKISVVSYDFLEVMKASRKSLNVEFTTFRHWIHSANQLFKPLTIRLQSNITGYSSKFLFYWASYGPTLFGQMVHRLQNAEVMAKLMFKLPNLKNFMCSPREMQEVFQFGSDIPLDIMIPHMCSENLYEIYQKVFGIRHLVDQIYRNLGPAGTEETIQHFPWSRLLQDGEILVKKLTLLKQMPITSYPLRNLTILGVFQDIAAMLSSNVDDMWERFLPYIGKVLEIIDQTIIGDLNIDSTGWLVFKHFVAIPESLLYFAGPRMKQMSRNGIQVKYLLGGGGGPVASYLYGMLNRSQEIAIAALNAYADPERILRSFITVDLRKEKLCESLSVTKFLHFAKPMDIQKFEQDICSLFKQVDLKAIVSLVHQEPLVQKIASHFAVLEKFFDSFKIADIVFDAIMAKPQKFSDGDFRENEIPPITINWMDTAEQVLEIYLSVLHMMDQEEISIFADFLDPIVNKTEVFEEVSYNDWTNAATNMLDEFNKMFSSDETMEVIWTVVKKAHVLAQGLLGVTNEHLDDLTGGKFSVSSFVLAPSFKEVIQLFEEYPDTFAIFLMGALKIIGHPKYLGKVIRYHFGYLKGLCTDPELCEIMAVPSSGNTTCTHLRHIWCETISKDWGNIVNELASEVDGVKSIIDFITGFTNTSYDGEQNMNLTDLTNQAIATAQMAEELMGFQCLTFDDTKARWVELETFSATWDFFERDYMDSLVTLRPSDFSMIIGLAMSFADKPLLKLTKGKNVWATINYINRLLRNLVSYFRSLRGNTFSLDEIFRPFPETYRIAKLVQYLPFLLEASLETALTKPFDAIIETLANGGNFSAVCKPGIAGARNVLFIHKEIEDKVLQVWNALCSLDLKALMFEHAKFLGFGESPDDLATLFEDRNQPPANFSGLVTNLVDYTDSLWGIMENPPNLKNIDWPPLISKKEAWVGLVQRILSLLEGYDVNTISKSFQKLFEFLNTKLADKFGPDSKAWYYFKMTLYGLRTSAEVALGQYELFDKDQVNLLEAYPIPTLRNIIMAVSSLPEILDSLLDGWTLYAFNPDLMKEKFDKLSTPGKPLQMGNVCANEMIFDTLFPLPATSKVKKRFLKPIICNLTKTITNPKQIVEELKNVAGVSQALKMIQVAVRKAPVSPSDANVTALVATITRAADVLRSVLRREPDISLGAPFNPASWEAIPNILISKVMKIVSLGPSKLVALGGNLLKLIIGKSLNIKFPGLGKKKTSAPPSPSLTTKISGPTTRKRSPPPKPFGSRPSPRTLPSKPYKRTPPPKPYPRNDETKSELSYFNDALYAANRAMPALKKGIQESNPTPQRRLTLLQALGPKNRQLGRYLEILNHLPAVIKVILLSSSNISSVSVESNFSSIYFTQWCQSLWKSHLTVPMKLGPSIDRVMEIICRTNYSRLQSEIEGMVGYELVYNPAKETIWAETVYNAIDLYKVVDWFQRNSDNYEWISDYEEWDNILSFVARELVEFGSPEQIAEFVRNFLAAMKMVDSDFISFFNTTEAAWVRLRTAISSLVNFEKQHTTDALSNLNIWKVFNRLWRYPEALRELISRWSSAEYFQEISEMLIVANLSMNQLCLEDSRHFFRLLFPVEDMDISATLELRLCPYEELDPTLLAEELSQMSESDFDFLLEFVTLQSDNFYYFLNDSTGLVNGAAKALKNVSEDEFTHSLQRTWKKFSVVGKNFLSKVRTEKEEQPTRYNDDDPDFLFVLSEASWVIGIVDDLIDEDFALWKYFKVFLRTSMTFGQTFNVWADRLEIESDVLSISSLFPNEDKLTEIIGGLLAEEFPAEFFTGLFNPKNFWSLLGRGSWASVFCTNKFFKLFKFPFDSTKLRNKLCRLVRERPMVSEILSEYISLKPIFDNIVELFSYDVKKHDDKNLWSLLDDNLAQLVSNIMAIVEVKKVESKNSIDSYLEMFLEQLTLMLKTGDVGICDSFLEFTGIKDALSLRGLSPFLNVLNVIAERSYKSVDSLMDAATLFCENKNITTKALFSKINKMYFMQQFRLILKNEQSAEWRAIEKGYQNSAFQCNNSVTYITYLVESITDALEQFEVNAETWKQCFLSANNGLSKFGRTVDKIVEMASVIGDKLGKYIDLFGNLGEKVDLPEITSLPPPSPPMKKDPDPLSLVANGFTKPVGRFQKMITTLKDPHQFTSGMQKLFRINASVIHELLKADINLEFLVNVFDVKNGSGLCVEAVFLKLFRFHVLSNLTASEIYHNVCHSGIDFIELAQYILREVDLDRLKELVRSTPVEYMFDEEKADSFSINIGNIFDTVLGALHTVKNTTRNIENLPDLLEHVSFGEIFDMLGTFEPFLFGDMAPDTLLEELFNLLEILRDDEKDPFFSTLISDIQNLIRGIQSMTLLRSADIFMLPLEKFFGSPRSFEEQLEGFNISANVTHAIMKSKLNYFRILITKDSLLTREDFAYELFCNRTNNTIYSINETALAVAGSNLTEVYTSLCSLDRKALANLTETFKNDFNISGLARNVLLMLSNDYTSKILDRLIQTIEIMPSETVETIEGMLDPVQQLLEIVQRRIQNGQLEYWLAKIEEEDGLITDSDLVKFACGQYVPMYNGLSISWRIFTHFKNEAEKNSTTTTTLQKSSSRKKRSVQQMPSPKPVPQNQTKNTEKKNPRFFDPKKYSKEELAFFEDVLGFGGEHCVKFVIDLSESNMGKVLWTFLKPLMMGKILYAPDTPAVRNILALSNRTFEELASIKRLIQETYNRIDQVSELIDVAKIGLDSVVNIISNPFISAVLKEQMGLDLMELLGGGLLRDIEIPDGITDQVKDMSKMALDYISCVRLDRFRPVPLKDIHAKAAQMIKSTDLLVAIEFMNEEFETYADAVPGDPIPSTMVFHNGLAYPKHIKYTIIIDLRNTMTTSEMEEPAFVPEPRDSVLASHRYIRGFMQIQDMMERAVIKAHTGGLNYSDLNSLRIHAGPDHVQLVTRSMAYPCFWQDSFLPQAIFLMPIVMVMIWLNSYGSIIRQLVWDKESGIKEVMKTMGMKGWVAWLAWLLNNMSSNLIISALIILALRLGSIVHLSDPLLLFSFYVLYTFVISMQAFMVAAFFDKASVALLVGCLLYLIQYLPYSIFITLENSGQLETWSHVLMCMCAPTAFAFGTLLIGRFEVASMGMTFSNMDYRGMTSSPLNMQELFMVLFLDMIVYFLIGWYVSNIRPGKHGIPERWYFPISLQYWGLDRWIGAHSERDAVRDSNFKFNPTLHEPVTGVQKIGIQVVNLCKQFGNKTAVSNLNIDMYDGQITAVLGHNGAGKTTMIHMLAGILEPTSGTSYVYGADMLKDYTKVRKMLGLCPQHNALMDSLTVIEHLEFFGALKTGRDAATLKKEVERLLKVCGLYMKRHALAKNLSGGQKRRLAMSMAFVGESKLIILDEPTSGVDACARRGIWEFILREKANRTILLTTHHLDEADVLGDRIVIMHMGKAHCSGSSMFLKQQFGTGYHLTISKEIPEQNDDDKEQHKMSDSKDVLDFVDRFIPDTRLVEQIGPELTIALPNSDMVRHQFQKFFKHLDDSQEKLGIAAYGVSDTTMEEVFLRVTETINSGKDLNVEAMQVDQLETRKYKHDLTNEEQHDHADDGLSCTKKKINGFHLKLRMVRALYTKRFNHFRRSKMFFVTQVILPVILVMLAMLAVSVTPKPVDPPLLRLHPTTIKPKPIDVGSFFKSMHDHPAADQLLEAMKRYYGVNICNALRWRNGTHCFQRNPDFPGVPFKAPYETRCQCGELTNWVCNGSKLEPPSWEIDSGRIYDIDKYDEHEYVWDTFPEFLDKRFGGLKFEHNAAQGRPKVTAYYENRNYHAIAAYINEANNVILQWKLPNTTEDPLNYRISTYSKPIRFGLVFDFQTMNQLISEAAIVVMLQSAFGFVAAGFVVFVMMEKSSKEKRQQFIYGVGPVMYWVIQFTWDMLVFLIPLSLTAAVFKLVGVDIYSYRENFTTCIFLIWANVYAVTPMNYLMSRLFNDPTSAYVTLMILNVFLGAGLTMIGVLADFYSRFSKHILADFAKSIDFVFRFFPQYNMFRGIVMITFNQIIHFLFASFGGDYYTTPLSFRIAGKFIVNQVIFGSVMFILVLILETRIFHSDKIKTETAVDPTENEDIQYERKRVISGTTKSDVLTVFQLSKTYKMGMTRKHAVKNVCFSIPKGECFGLLGVNGAGKSTTFRMITGDTFPSSGVVTLYGRNITNNLAEVRQQIGYCPQFDALDKLLTATEILYCYCRIKGIPETEIDKITQRALERFDLTPFANKTVNGYSGGTKRKLSTAIALLGDPDIVLMDEPTTGMDPATKRSVWNNVLSVVKDNRSVILTSHSMAECDYLCTRLAIMVNGELKCLGTPQYLKDRYGEGFTVKLKVTEQMFITKITDHLMKVFGASNVLVTDSHYNSVQYNIHSGRLSDVFGVLEAVKAPFTVEDYSVSQTTLDQVFVNFALKQHEFDDDEETGEGDDSASVLSWDGEERTLLEGPTRSDPDASNITTISSGTNQESQRSISSSSGTFTQNC